MSASEVSSQAAPHRAEKSKRLEEKLHLSPDDLRAIFARPVAYHRLLAIAGGTVSAGVFLSQLIYWSERTDDSEGWVYKTLEDWWDETALGRYELKTIRKALLDRKLIKEKLSGVPARLHYRIEWDALSEALAKAIRSHQEHVSKRGAPTNQFVAMPHTDDQPVAVPQTRARECHKPVCGNATNKPGASPQAIIDQRVLTQSTAESTTTTTRARAHTQAHAPVEQTPSSSSFSLTSVVKEEEESLGHLSSKDRLELDAIAKDFGSDPRQKAKALAIAKRRGMAFVREQAQIVRSNPKIENLAGAFEAACDSPEGWKRRKAAAKKPVRPKPAEPKPEEAPSEPRADFSAELAWWQSATDAQREDILQDPRFDLYRKSMRKGVTAASLGLPVLREALAELAKDAACAATETLKAQQPEAEAA